MSFDYIRDERMAWDSNIHRLENFEQKLGDKLHNCKISVACFSTDYLSVSKIQSSIMEVILKYMFHLETGILKILIVLPPM